MTNHTYWNLSGDFKHKSVANHTLQINSSQLLAFNDVQTPTGQILPVVKTPFDFNQASKIGSENRLTGAIDGGGKPGIDHAYVVSDDPDKSSNMKEVACLECSGRTMTIYTT